MTRTTLRTDRPTRLTESDRAKLARNIAPVRKFTAAHAAWIALALVVVAFVVGAL